MNESVNVLVFVCTVVRPSISGWADPNQHGTCRFRVCWYWNGFLLWDES